MFYRLMQGVAAAALLFGAAGNTCIPANVYTPLDQPVTMAIINSTPYRAIFTGGAFDPLDQNTVPQADAIAVESQANDPDHLGVVTMKTLACRRALSVGSPELVNRVKELGQDVTEPRGLIEGVWFSDAPAGTPDEISSGAGTAGPLTIQQGTDYPCGSFVIIRLVEDPADSGQFRVQFDGVIH